MQGTSRMSKKLKTGPSSENRAARDVHPVSSTAKHGGYTEDVHRLGEREGDGASLRDFIKNEIAAVKAELKTEILLAKAELGTSIKNDAKNSSFGRLLNGFQVGSESCAVLKMLTTINRGVPAMQEHSLSYQFTHFFEKYYMPALGCAQILYQEKFGTMLNPHFLTETLENLATSTGSNNPLVAGHPDSVEAKQVDALKQFVSTPWSSATPLVLSSSEVKTSAANFMTRTTSLGHDLRFTTDILIPNHNSKRKEDSSSSVQYDAYEPLPLHHSKTYESEPKIQTPQQTYEPQPQYETQPQYIVSNQQPTEYTPILAHEDGGLEFDIVLNGLDNDNQFHTETPPTTTTTMLEHPDPHDLYRSDVDHHERLSQELEGLIQATTEKTFSSL